MLGVSSLSQESKDNNFTLWESGIKYTEKTNKKKFLKIAIIPIVALLSALIGGAISSIMIINSYSGSIKAYKEEFERISQDELASSRSMTKAAQKVGPSIVGIIKTPSSWMNEAQEGSLGSGIIFDEKGYIVTNQHIINKVGNITVILPGGHKEKATLVAQDFKSDIAILKINMSNLKAVELKASNDVKTGETVIGMGNPLGEEFSGTIVSGIIGATSKVIKIDDRAYKIYQTDMVFSDGTSGGAVVNKAGEVIGIINNRLNSTQEGSYIMPVSEAKPIIDALMVKGKLETPFLGVKTYLIDDERSKLYNVPIGLGVIDVVKGTAAEKYGILKEDIILEVNGGAVSKITDITDLLEGKRPGDKITIKVYRDGKKIDIDAALIKLSSH